MDDQVPCRSRDNDQLGVTRKWSGGSAPPPHLGGRSDSNFFRFGLLDTGEAQDVVGRLAAWLLAWKMKRWSFCMALSQLCK